MSGDALVEPRCGSRQARSEARDWLPTREEVGQGCKCRAAGVAALVGEDDVEALHPLLLGQVGKESGGIGILEGDGSQPSVAIPGEERAGGEATERAFGVVEDGCGAGNQHLFAYPTPTGVITSRS